MRFSANPRVCQRGVLQTGASRPPLHLGKPTRQLLCRTTNQNVFNFLWRRASLAECRVQPQFSCKRGGKPLFTAAARLSVRAACFQFC